LQPAELRQNNASAAERARGKNISLSLSLGVRRGERSGKKGKVIGGALLALNRDGNAPIRPHKRLRKNIEFHTANSKSEYAFRLDYEEVTIFSPS